MLFDLKLGDLIVLLIDEILNIWHPPPHILLTTSEILNISFLGLIFKIVCNKNKYNTDINGLIELSNKITK